MNELADEPTTQGPSVLSKPQRRILGVLVEKAFTTPDQYPLTLKALTTGCNQKSNRDPVTTYSEESVEQTLDELRSLGLVACLHTESGRAERFRHYLRKAYPFSEAQLAIVAELWMRGRQQLGELRSRASRMVPIESLEDLRAELSDLMAKGYATADGPLERRGIEVDHGFYSDAEQSRMTAAAPVRDEAIVAAAPKSPSPSPDVLADLNASIRDLQRARDEQADQISALRDELDQVASELVQLRDALGA